jgi:pimeloyl-ACP methyl ester carboxylesterase
MTSWQSGDVAANGIRLHYTRTGAGADQARPPLVLAHGVTDDGLCWSPIAAALEADYDVIMVDARGHGRSEAPERGYDAATQAADLHGLIQSLGLDRPLLLGHSMGAATTLALAGLYPETPRAIVLEDPPGWWLPTPPGAAHQARASIGGWIESLQRKTREQLLAEQRAATPGWSEAELEPWADSKLLVSLNVLDVFRESPSANVDWPSLLPRVSCPALLLTADAALGAALSEEGAAALRAHVPQLQVAHIAGAGHNIRRDQPARFLEVVRAFLAEHAP